VIRPAVSKSPDPELPPETCTVEGTEIAFGLLARTVAKLACFGESFFTAPFGWWIPNTCSPGAGMSCLIWIAGIPGGASASLRTL